MASTDNALERTLPPGSALPATPERGRPRTRYPSHLTREVDAEGNPRPLLHRRGTSRTYETLEDLLKEAGYKETRIFTPEVERREAEREEHKERGTRREEGSGAGVGGAVVKLFSTWMSASSKRARPERAAGDNDGSISSSPLAHRSSKASTLRLSSPPTSSSSSSLTVRPRGSNSHSASLQQQSLTRPSLSSASSTLHPHSRARLALRHVASAPQIDKRRQGTRTQSRTSRSGKPKAPVPPLPVTWLESISSALLSPRLHPSPSPPVSPSTGPSKPSILVQRAHTSVGAVTIANVVCRSAPSSRSCSAVRPSRVLVPAIAQTTVCEGPGAATLLPHSAQHPPDPDPSQAEEDEDEELNLTMMLIPAKRQHSIRSLRSVLLHHTASTPATVLHEEYERMMRRRIADNAADVEHAGDGHWDSGEFLTARVKRKRSRLPRNWGWSS